MAEFFKYADRSADDYINWGEVGKNVSNMLTETYKLREERKKTLDDETNLLANTIADSPLGEHRGAKDAALDLASNASNYLLMQTKLFKSGQLSEKDYVRNRQKLSDGVKTSYQALQNYQKVFADKMDRYKTNQSAFMELKSMEMAEGFGDFSKSGFFINPTTGDVNIAMKEEKEVNGQKVFTMSANPGKVTSVNALNAMIQGKWDRYDVNAQTGAFVESIGAKLTAIRKVGSETRAGSITELLDPTKDIYVDDATKQVIASFKQAETNAIDAMLANDFNRLSLMTDHMKFKDGKQYDFAYTKEEADKDPSKIFMVGDASTGTYKPQFTQKQIEESNQWVRESLRAQYDKKEKIDTYNEPQKKPFDVQAAEYSDKKKQAKNIGKYLGWMINGSDAEVREALTQLENSVPGTRIKRDDNGMLITRPDNTTSYVPFRDGNGNPVTPSQFGAGAGSYFMPNVDPSLVEEGAKIGARGKKFNSTTTAESSTTTSVVNPKYQNFVQSQAYVGKGDLSKTISQLSQFGSKAGVSVGKSDDGKKLKLKYGNNEVEIDVNDNDANQQVQNFLSANYSKTQVNGNFPPEPIKPVGSSNPAPR